MSADDYYAGARSEFAAEFENQLNDGLYLIKRKEVRGPRGAIPHQTAILQAGTEQGAFGDNNASQFVTEKVTDAKGIPVRKQQQFRKFGVEVVEARITNVDPNPQYKQRMVKVQQALAELAVARQNRLKEEEESCWSPPAARRKSRPSARKPCATRSNAPPRRKPTSNWR